MATITIVVTTELAYPKREVLASFTDTNIKVAGVGVLPSDFGLDSIDSISASDVQIAGSVNTQTLRCKYDPVTAKVFFFGQADDSGTTVAKPLAIIPGDIAAVPVVFLKATGNKINRTS